MKPKPPCVEVYMWLRANLGKHCLGALTSVDAKALDAAVHIVELYAYDNDESLFAAFRAVVMRMHRAETRELAYHAIAMVRNWEDREVMWREAGLPAFERLRVCIWEPKARRALEGIEEAKSAAVS